MASKLFYLIPAILLVLIPLISAEIAVNVNYPQKVYLESETSVDIFVEVPIAAENSTIIYSINALGEIISFNESRAFNISLPTQSIGLKEFSLAVYDNESELFLQNYSYSVTKDWDNDGYIAADLGGNDCNDQNAQINPGKSEIYNNFIDDDCNQDTDDVRTTAEVTETVYEIEEKAKIKINSRSDQNISIDIIFNKDDEVAYSTTLKGPYPKTFNSKSLDDVGNYTVYLNEDGFLSELARFSIKNNLKVSINFTPEKPLKNEEIQFEAVPSGGTSGYTYKWNFGDSKTSTIKRPVHTYTSEDEFSVTLTVKDSSGNTATATESVETLTPYTITLTLQDYSGKQLISGAEVYIGEKHVTSSSKGIAAFQLAKGNYDIQILHSKYESFFGEIEVKANKQLTYKLNKTFYDDAIPAITMINPKNNDIVSKSDANFYFELSDKTNCDCMLFTSKDKQYWTKKSELTNLMNYSNTSFFADNFLDGKYYWKVECIDSFENKAETKPWQFEINTSESLELRDKYLSLNDEMKEKITQAKNEIVLIKNKFSGLTSDEKIVSNAIGWEAQVEDKISEMDKINRDIFNLRYRKVNTSDRYEMAVNLTKSFEKNKKAVISGIKVNSVSSLVYYPEEDMILEITRQFIDALGYNDTKLNIKAFSQEIAKMQQRLTVTSTFANVEIFYLNGTTQKATMVSRTLSFNNTPENMSLIEYIPKDVYPKASDISFIKGSFKILKEDPLIELSMEDQKITYLIPVQKNPDEMESTATLIVPRKIELTESPGISAFSVFSMFNGEKTELWFGISAIAVVILLIYLLFALNIFAKVIEKFSAKGNRQVLMKISTLMEEANNALEANNTDNAVMIFREIELFYNELNPETSSSIIGDLSNLANKINLAKIDILFRNSTYLHENLKDREAIEAYNKIVDYYEKLTEKAKMEVYERLDNLKRMLNGIK